MKDLPLSPFWPFWLIGKSITYVESMRTWRTNPPPRNQPFQSFTMIALICEGADFRSPVSRFCYCCNVCGAGASIVASSSPATRSLALAFLLFVSRTVDVHRGPDVGVPHEFLLHANRRSQFIEERVGVLKRIPQRFSIPIPRPSGRRYSCPKLSAWKGRPVSLFGNSHCCSVSKH